ncbi:hypothetical protein AB1046_16610 [Promicromonospora sp. Populi]|uniref:hypothetical protein n=1 Tax=Promicromonospora sp. Populi TaxID=3239420 RepID=UPI0034E1C281
MRSKMRVPLSLALGAVLVLTGLVATPGVAATSGVAATPDVAPPDGTTTARVTARAEDVVVSARITLPSGGDVRGSITGTMTITHNGTSAVVRTGNMTMRDPAGRVLQGSQFVAAGTPNAWNSTVPLPTDAEPGIYGVTLTAQVDVTTDDGVFTVPIRITDPVQVPFRAKRSIPLIWLSPAGALAGATISVSGVANIRSLSDWETSPAANQEVKLYFDPTGSAAETLRATLTTDASGFFTSRQTPEGSGTWRMEMPQTNSGIRAVWTLSNTETARDRILREGSVSATEGGFTAGDHIMTQDVVVGLDPVQRRIDVGSLGFTIGGTSGWVSAESQRGEGAYPDGYRVQQDLRHSGIGTSNVYITFRATHPAGVYDIGIRDAMKACSAPDWDGNTGATSNCTHNVLVEDPTVATIVVKRASTTTVTASPTSFPAPRNVTVRGTVRRVQLVSTGGVAERPAPGVSVDLYFDPTGSAPSELKRTVTTGTDGTYSTSIRTATSGRWIAKYTGTSLVAASQDTVTVTVG